jgi:hypothetical protein
MSEPAPETTARPPRRFERFEVHWLLGKSVRSMLWEVHDPEQDRLLALPHLQLHGAAIERWNRKERTRRRG